MIDLYSFSNLTTLLVPIIICAALSGIVGPIVVSRKMTSIAGGIAHIALGGIGAGYFLGIEPYLSAVMWSAAAGVVLSLLYLKGKHHLETIISLLWSFGMSLGLILLYFSPANDLELHDLLFGDITQINSYYLLIGSLITFVFSAAFFRYYPTIEAVVFDEEFAEIRGISLPFAIPLLFIAISLCVVVLVKIVGVILTIGILTIPALIAVEESRNLKEASFLAAAISAFSALGGVGLSLSLGREDSLLPVGPAIVLVSCGIYFIWLFLKPLRY